MYNNPMNDNYLEQQINDLDQRITEARKLLDDPELSFLAKMEIEELEKQKEELEQSASTPIHEDKNEDQDDSLDVNPNRQKPE